MAASYLPFAPHPSLGGRVAVVTGGGRGLGREMALALAEAGACVVVTSARERAELDEVCVQAERLGAGERMLALQADVRDFADCERVVAETRRVFGRLEVLVNNAGRGLLLVSPTFNVEPARFYEAPVEGWREIVETNVIGQFHMARAAAPHMVAQGFGRIVNISTSEATMTRIGYSPYGPSKAALEACSVVWAKDLGGTGVTVNVLLPGGATDTKLLPDGPNKRGADGLLLAPEIMRAPILWLASDAADGHTGERYIAKLWDPALDPDLAAARARCPRHNQPTIM